VEGEKKMCGTVTGFCCGSRLVKVHEREVGTTTGPYCYRALLHRVVTVHARWVCARDPYCFGWVLFMQPVLFVRSNSVM
jgi:hypothetical protein